MSPHQGLLLVFNTHTELALPLNTELALSLNTKLALTSSSHNRSGRSINWSHSWWCQFFLLPLQLSISDFIPVSLINICMLMTLTSSMPKLQTHISNYLLKISSWVCHKCLKFNRSKSEKVIFPLLPTPSLCFPIMEYCNLTHLVPLL